MPFQSVELRLALEQDTRSNRNPRRCPHRSMVL
jgi:hypothetical protein